MINHCPRFPQRDCLYGLPNEIRACLRERAIQIGIDLGPEIRAMRDTPFCRGHDNSDTLGDIFQIGDNLTGLPKGELPRSSLDIEIKLGQG
jgi:hypothetical protein